MRYIPLYLCVLLFILLTFSCGSTNVKNRVLDTLYPSETTINPYHNDWTVKHYRKRINEFKSEPLTFGDIVFIGNSLTELGRDWSKRLDGIKIKNRGIAGDGTDGVLARLDETIYAKPRQIFLLIGINDLFNLHDNLGIPSAEYVGNNIVKIAKTIKKKSPKTELYIQTILPVRTVGMDENIKTVNELIRRNATKEAYSIIDLYTAFVDHEGQLNSAYTVDGTHLNEAGYAVWCKLLRNHLSKDIINITYPKGKRKALIMSYDDGLKDDINLVKLFNKYNIVGTFNLSSELLGTVKSWTIGGKTEDQFYLPKSQIFKLFKGHEIAAHGASHKNLVKLSEAEILSEIEKDQIELARLSKKTIKSFAYPFGVANEKIAELFSSTGLTNARTVQESQNFQLPTNSFLWNPTCRDRDAMEFADKYLSLNSSSLSLFYVWGHSWELRDSARWANMALFVKTIANQRDIWYVGNGDFQEYLDAINTLQISDHAIVNPPGNKTVWYQHGKAKKKLKPGTQITF